MNNKFIPKLFKLLCLLFLLAPIFVIILYSFNDSEIMTIWKGFSYKYYLSLFDNEYLIRSLMLSVKIAVISASLSIVIGIMVASYIKSKRSIFFNKLLTVQMMLPDIITGLGIIILIITASIIFDTKLKLGYWGIVIAHTTASLPYTIFIVLNRLTRLNQEIIESARDLGANQYVIWSKIILPLLYPSLVTSWVIAFIISMDDVVLASFTSGPGATTLTMQIYSKLRYGMSPEVNALASMLIAVNLICIAKIMLIRKR